MITNKIISFKQMIKEFKFENGREPNDNEKNKIKKYIRQHTPLEKIDGESYNVDNDDPFNDNSCFALLKLENKIDFKDNKYKSSINEEGSELYSEGYFGPKSLTFNRKTRIDTNIDLEKEIDDEFAISMLIKGDLRLQSRVFSLFGYVKDDVDTSFDGLNVYIVNNTRKRYEDGGEPRSYLVVSSKKDDDEKTFCSVKMSSKKRMWFNGKWNLFTMSIKYYKKKFRYYNRIEDFCDVYFGLNEVAYLKIIGIKGFTKEDIFSKYFSIGGMQIKYYDSNKTNFKGKIQQILFYNKVIDEEKQVKLVKEYTHRNNLQNPSEYIFANEAWKSEYLADPFDNDKGVLVIPFNKKLQAFAKKDSGYLKIGPSKQNNVVDYIGDSSNIEYIEGKFHEAVKITNEIAYRIYTEKMNDLIKNNNFSISFWFKVNDANISQTLFTILGFMYNGESSYHNGLGLIVKDKKLYLLDVKNSCNDDCDENCNDDEDIQDCRDERERLYNVCRDNCKYCTAGVLDVFKDDHGTGLWQLNDNADDESGDNDGEWEGNEQYEDGKYGNSAKFDGDSYIKGEWGVNADNYTVTAWFKTDEDGDRTIWTGMDNNYIYIKLKDGKIEASDGNDDNLLTTDNEYNDNEWHFVSLRKDDGGALEMIVDDFVEHLQGDSEDTNADTNENAKSRIGSYNNGSGEEDKFIGNIDQIRTFDIYLSDDQIDDIRTEGSGCFNDDDICKSCYKISNMDIIENDWNFIMISVRDKYVKIHLNNSSYGCEFNEIIFPYIRSTYQYPMVLGAYMREDNDDTIKDFDGAIDQFRVYKEYIDDDNFLTYIKEEQRYYDV